MHIAAKNEHVAIFKLLYLNGADTAIKDWVGINQTRHSYLPASLLLIVFIYCHSFIHLALRYRSRIQEEKTPIDNCPDPSKFLSAFELALLRDLNKLKAENTELRKTLDQKEFEVNRLKRAVDEQKNIVAQVSQDKASLEIEGYRLKRVVEVKDNEIQRLSTTKSNLENQLNELKGVVESHKNIVTQVSQDKVSFELEVNRLKQVLEVKGHEIQRLSTFHQNVTTCNGTVHVENCKVHR